MKYMYICILSEWSGQSLTSRAGYSTCNKCTINMHANLPHAARFNTQYNVSATDFFGNIMGYAKVNTKRELKHLGEPVDTSEWLNAPTEVNAYYNPPYNQFGELHTLSM